MSDNALLNGIALGVSFTNLILMSWLGLTVLLNSGQRTRGVWISGSGLLAGALFFLCHTAILGLGPSFQAPELNIWWQLGWLPLVVLPLNWYLVALWYAGQWPDGVRWPRQPAPTLLVLAVGAGLLGWLLLGRPLPAFARLLQADFVATTPFLLAYPLYALLCIGLAARSLLQMDAGQDVRRRQARPWLLGATAGLLVISLLVAGVVLWAMLSRPAESAPVRLNTLATLATGLDLLIAGLIAGVVIQLGQAIVSYEVFTEQGLPRQEFQRQWRSAVALAVALGLLAGGGLTLWPATPIYPLLAVILLVTLFFALSLWRSWQWRGQYLHRLRPLVASQHLYDQMLTGSAAAFDAGSPFAILCRDVLQTTRAQLTPLGALAPLLQWLPYPAGSPAIELPPQLPARFQSPTDRGLRLTPEQWAIPLWSERGLIGVLLLGPRLNYKPYTQEELEIAQASAERLVDTWASAEIGRRLLALQRQRLAESQLLDRQTRRVIHDDVLPDLHSALLLLGNHPAHAEAVTSLTNAHRQLANLLREMPPATLPDLEKLGLLTALRRLVAGELGNAFDDVAWRVSPGSDTVAGRLSSVQSAILFYAAREVLRNAARHGRGAATRSRPLSVIITVSGGDELSVCVEDDGVGLANSAGRRGGQGLALHSTMLAVVGGVLQLESEANRFTRVTLTSGPLNTA
ncbi:MAG: hypothetical protein Kow0031_16090 [Anaerolineae bacterium]